MRRPGVDLAPFLLSHPEGHLQIAASCSLPEPRPGAGGGVSVSLALLEGGGVQRTREWGHQPVIVVVPTNNRLCPCPRLLTGRRQDGV